MLQTTTTGLDPAASTMLDSILQRGALPGGGPGEAEGFGAAFSGAGVESSDVEDGLSGGAQQPGGEALDYQHR